MSLRYRVWSGLVLVALLTSGAAHAAVHAWIDNTDAAADGTIQLILEHDGPTNDEPDLAPLKQDFDVLSSSSSSSMQIINGTVSSHVRWSLSLAPKHSGDLRIPPISWGGEQSEPLIVHVGGSPSNAQASTSRTVFVETTAEPGRPYVQAQVDVTVRIYSQVPLYHASLELPSSNDVLVQQIGADRNEMLVKDGVRYQVVERHYALFPQRSGSLTVPGPVLDAQIAVRGRNPLGDQFDNLFGNMRSLNNMFTTLKPIKEHGEDLSLNVLPRPDGALGDYWLPARDVKLGAEWRPDSAQVNAGDPVTLHLRLQAQGLTAAQLPDLSALLQLPPGVRAYPDQAKLDNDTHGDLLLGTRDQNIALIADQPGQFKVPPLTIHWWDVQSNQPRGDDVARADPHRLAGRGSTDRGACPHHERPGGSGPDSNNQRTRARQRDDCGGGSLALGERRARKPLGPHTHRLVSHPQARRTAPGKAASPRDRGTPRLDLGGSEGISRRVPS